MTEYETYRQQFINKADQDDEGYVRNRFDAMEFAFDFGYAEGKEAAFRKVIEALNSDPARDLMDDFSVNWAKWLQENKEKILGDE